MGAVLRPDKASWVITSAPLTCELAALIKCNLPYGQSKWRSQARSAARRHTVVVQRVSYLLGDPTAPVCLLYHIADVSRSVWQYWASARAAQLADWRSADGVYRFSVENTDVAVSPHTLAYVTDWPAGRLRHARRRIYVQFGAPDFGRCDTTHCAVWFSSIHGSNVRFSTALASGPCPLLHAAGRRRMPMFHGASGVSLPCLLPPYMSVWAANNGFPLLADMCHLYTMPHEYMTKLLPHTAQR